MNELEQALKREYLRQQLWNTFQKYEFHRVEGYKTIEASIMRSLPQAKLDTLELFYSEVELFIKEGYINHPDRHKIKIRSKRNFLLRWKSKFWADAS